MKVTAVIALKAEYRLAVLLQVSGLARSTFFYHQKRLNDPDPRQELKDAIIEVFTTSQRRYGHRRVHAVLRGAGWQVAKKTVCKLMRELNLVCKARRRRGYVSYRGEVGEVADNLLDRDFTATAPNQKWVTDITQFTVADTKIYLSAVMDLFDRQIIGYSISRSPNMALVLESLDQALPTLRAGERPLVHSDQGFQYQHRRWRERLAAVGAVQSMSRKGNCHDNAMIENFFGHLKEEAFTHEAFDSVESLHTALTDYLNWYNHDRICEDQANLSPAQYRAHTLAA